MGRIEIDSADIPQSRRGTPFTDEEVSRLVEEVRERKDIIYGTAEQPAQLHKIREAWEEIAEVISSVSNITRSSDQCRKRFNDIKRRGQKMVVTKKRGRPPKNRPKLESGELLENQFEDPDDLEFEAHEYEYEMPALIDDDDPDYEPSPKKREVKIIIPKEITMADKPNPPTTAPRNASPIPQVSVQSMPQSPVHPKSESPSLPSPQPQSPPITKPQVSPASRPPGSAGPRPPGSLGPKPKPSLAPRPPGSAGPKPQGPPGSKPQGPPGSRPNGPPGPRPNGPPLSKPKVVVVRKPVDPTKPPSQPRQPQQPQEGHHPFLELQQNGFNMLKRELSGFRDSVMSLNTRLNHLEVALRPIGHIADSLSRIANAVERLTCPPDEGEP